MVKQELIITPTTVSSYGIAFKSSDKEIPSIEEEIKSIRKKLWGVDKDEE